MRLPDLADAHWIDAPEVAAPLADLRAAAGTDGPRAGALRYHGTDLAALVALVEAGLGLAVLPARVSLPATVVGVPLRAPRLVHRTELPHGHLAAGPARELAAELVVAGSTFVGTDTGNERA